MGNKRINVSICDKDEAVCNYISSIIGKYSIINDAEIWSDSFYSGKAFIKAMETSRYDIAFIEIDLGDMNGIRIGKFIRNVNHNNEMQIIYMSEFYFYTMELFASQPLHYMVKPVDEECIIKTFSRAINIIEENNLLFQYTKKKKLLWEEISNIMYFESFNRQLIMHTRNGKVVFYGRLKDVYERLSGQGFFYIHQSYIINHKYIKEYDGYSILMYNNIRIEISQQRRKRVQDILADIFKADVI